MPQQGPQIIERRFIRHPSHMPISYDLSENLPRSDHHLRNVSEGGVCFASTAPLEIGQPIRLRIPVFGETFEVAGSVAWCRPAARGYEIGVAFDHRQDRFAVRMVEQLCYIEDYRTRVEREEGRTLTSEQAAAEWVSRFADQFPSLR